MADIDIDTYVIKAKNGDEVVVDVERQPAHGSGIPRRFAEMVENFDSLRPRQRARVLWAKRFRRAMSETGTTQQDLGRIIDTPPSSISSWANAVSMPGPDAMKRLSAYFGTDTSKWTEPEEAPSVQEAPPAPASSLTLSEDEEALVRRVRRMSEEERDALFTLLHVLK